MYPRHDRQRAAGDRVEHRHQAQRRRPRWRPPTAPVPARIHSRSAPAENDGPSPSSTTTRAPARAGAPVKASVSAAISAASNALRRSGRVMRTRTTGPSCVIASGSDTGGTLHAEHAEARRDGGHLRPTRAGTRPSTVRVSRGSSTPSSHSRAVAKYWRPLALVGGADGVGICVADGRQHRRRLLAAHHADARRAATRTGTAARRRGRTCRSCRRRRSRPRSRSASAPRAPATAVTSFAPSRAMPPCS